MLRCITALAQDSVTARAGSASLTDGACAADQSYETSNGSPHTTGYSAFSSADYADGLKYSTLIMVRSASSLPGIAIPIGLIRYKSSHSHQDILIKPRHSHHSHQGIGCIYRECGYLPQSPCSRTEYWEGRCTCASANLSTVNVLWNGSQVATRTR